MNVPGAHINKVCLSGLDAIALADQLIRAGEFEVVVAGGMESMTQAPYLLAEGPRTGTKYGDAKLSTRWPTTACPTPSTRSPWAAHREGHATYGLTREEQDEFAAAATSGPPRRRRTACSTTRSCRSHPAAQGRPDRGP